ncbi:hypothetical protein BY996DRAFT_4577577 [Phakopsora pachyrhizi]|uniref:Expressed protein n=1 Tax=Phakopsora pachyrhizi TaxID=170000 RepID=A0AAV0BQ72_PHAPC|nr:hypothetical protein BY996DRAFT_4577577 [Phakopsora pachyrhizi]CAH7676277.1 expressed protein [Phakopsora pachyrhizi]CAH7688803.1 expressed protein [Phakopsora pachyrhizi]
MTLTSSNILRAIILLLEFPCLIGSISDNLISQFKLPEKTPLQPSKFLLNTSIPIISNISAPLLQGDLYEQVIFSGEDDFKTRNSLYKYNRVRLTPEKASETNPSLKGFVKQRCYHVSSLNQTDEDGDELMDNQVEDEDYCIFLNEGFNYKRGMVIFIRPSTLKKEIDKFVSFNSDSKFVTEVERSKFPYELKHMPHKGGLGSIATSKLRLGDRVMAEHALIVVFAMSKIRNALPWEEIQKMMVDLLPIKGREFFSRQHGTGETELEWITSAYARNIFSIGNDDDQSGGFAFLAEPAVDLNHDCRPNVAYNFNDITLQLEMYAIKDIVPGEELTVSYIPMNSPRKIRQESLKSHYGFDCRCSQCSLPERGVIASDNRLLQIEQLTKILTSWKDEGPRPNTAMAEHLIDLYKIENLYAAADVAYTIAALTYNTFGDSYQASRYSSLAISYGLYTREANWLDYEAHVNLEIDPESHWSYNYRVNDKNPDKLSKKTSTEALSSIKINRFNFDGDESCNMVDY